MKSTAKEVSFEWSHIGFYPQTEKIVKWSSEKH